jgi:hypothetical protein
VIKREEVVSFGVLGFLFGFCEGKRDVSASGRGKRFSL